MPAEPHVPVIGLVGGVGSGKSSLARAVSGLPGAPSDSPLRIAVVSGDEAGHRTLTFSHVQTQIRERFGAGVFAADGSVNRRAVAQRVFGPAPEAAAARRDLEEIVHPEINRLLKEQIDELRSRGEVDAILLDAAVLLEAGWGKLCDAVVFVDSPFEDRLRRVQASRGWDEAELRRREASQWPVEKKRRHADAVIDNSAELVEACRRLRRTIEDVISSGRSRDPSDPLIGDPSKGTRMEPSWSHDDVFPLIATAIDAIHARDGGYVTHDQIVTFLLENPEASGQIESARAAGDDNRTAEWIAHNMVAWFSQRITVGESDWTARFLRQKVDGKWAYQPAPSH